MAVSVPLYWLIIVISLMSLLAGFALGAWRTVLRSTPRRKPQTSEVETPPSALASLAADQAALFSTLEKLTTTVKRLSSRQGMRDARERDEGQQATPPVGTSKADLLRHYGMSGKVGPAFAQAQLDLERRTN